MLEAQAPLPLAADAETGLRVFAIAPAGRAILEACGAWQTLPAGLAAPYERMRVWQADSTPFGAGSIGFDAADSGEPELGTSWTTTGCGWACGTACADPPAGRRPAHGLPHRPSCASDPTP